MVPKRKTRRAEVTKKLRSTVDDTLDAPSRERREHVVTRGGLRRVEGKGSEGGAPPLSVIPQVFERAEKGSIKERTASVTGISSNS